jgi:Raf kinase inhibitor-like YbhB/YbcL family protein
MTRNFSGVCRDNAEAASPAGGGAFELTSPDIPAGGVIDKKFAYDEFGGGGENVSPELQWRNPPRGTKSFAIFAHDPDAPTGGAGFWHWIVIDIPASVRSFPQGAGRRDGTGLPAGARHVESDYGHDGWGGPCPPVGDPPHRYNFTIYALPVEKVEAPPNAKASLVGFIVNQQALGKASFTGLYGR